MNLFDYNMEQQLKTQAPLAARLRPESLKDFVGQHHIVGEDTVLRRAIENDALSSIILYGPPGSGKTTLAHIIAQETKSRFVQLSAVTSGVKDLKREIDEAIRQRGQFGKKTTLFVDEIHRFNKAQQDVLLPYVENGTLTLIGATTENPYFEVNSALVSRSQVFRLLPLTQDDLVQILNRAITDTERGLGKTKIKIAPKAIEHIANIAGGDARIALNALELAVTVAKGTVTLKDAEDALQQRALKYDKKGDEHYDTISAFIKSMRGSDADAALIWMFKMLAAGEDPKFIIRRMIIFASEDIGNADPQALQIAVTASQALEWVGLPEAEFALAQACVYLSLAPKSNAIKKAMGAVKQDIASKGRLVVPNQLRNAPVKGMADDQGFGVDYQYPHDFPGGVAKQAYKPDSLRGASYYKPSDRGFEKDLQERVAKIKKQILS